MLYIPRDHPGQVDTLNAKKQPRRQATADKIWGCMEWRGLLQIQRRQARLEISSLVDAEMARCCEEKIEWSDAGTLPCPHDPTAAKT